MAIVEPHDCRTSVKNVAFIGFADAYGEGWLERVRRRSPRARGIEDRRQRALHSAPTPSVTGQALKLVAGQARRGADRRLRHAGARCRRRR
ncbi:MAG: hypothetical protein MZW92_69225 [Comamonadaceae bacterium]|nr:hypothetical protein [Comamonadaceae bacterium]